MTERDFVYWLQGFFEMTEADTLTEKQIKMIKDHLGYVFQRSKPPISPPSGTRISDILSRDVMLDLTETPTARIC